MEEIDLKQRYQTALVALASMHEAIEKMKKFQCRLPADEVSTNSDYRTFRDSVVMRFAYTLDTTWKYTKFYLEKRFGAVHNSPKPVLRECQRNAILSEEETVAALEMVDARNLTAHIYREEVAEQIVKYIDQYYALLLAILTRTAPT